MSDPASRNDRLRELLDAVLDPDAAPGAGRAPLDVLARSAHASPYHFARRVSAAAGEPPVSLRRRVLLERAAWRLRSGAAVTETAWEAGYDSVEGFARAYARAWGHPPSATPRDPVGERGDPTAHWLPAPNGLHFHSPTSLWVQGSGSGAGGEQVSTLMARHDLADARRLLDAASVMSAEEWTRVRLPGAVLLVRSGPEESLALVLGRLVGGWEIWLAALEGREHPAPVEPDTAASLLSRLDAVGPRWLAFLDDVERRGAWHDSVVDALCEPPESFVLGAVLAHVLTYDAQRRGLARVLLRQAGVEVDDGDPIIWSRDPSSGA